MTKPGLAGVVILGSFLASFGSLRAQVVTIHGRVIEEEGRPVALATIEASPSHRTVSGADGSFRLPNLPTGTVRLVITAFGFDEAVINLPALSDTTVTITLTRRPVRLKAVEARLRRITVKGRVTEDRLRLGVDATIHVVTPDGQYRATTNGTGRFRVGDVVLADSAEVVMEAFGYLPQRVRINSARDTSIDFVAVEDPVARAMVERQLQRLTDRSSVLKYPVETGRAEALHQSGRSGRLYGATTT